MVIAVDPFWGDKPGENAQDFLRAFNRAMGDKSDEAKAKQFPNYLRADSEADDWWLGLSAAVQAKWEDIEAGFMVRWPRAVVVKKTSMEYEEELLGLKLRAQDLGRKEEVAGREMYTHIAWADNMRRLAKGAGVEAGSTYIGQVRKSLPLLIKEKVSGSYRTWALFLAAVQTIDIKFIKDGADVLRKDAEKQRALETRVQRLESTPESPTAGIRHDMARTSLNTTPSSSTTLEPTRTTADNPYVGIAGGQGNLFGGQRPRTPRTPPGPVTLQSQAELRARIAAIPHHPATDAGRAAYKAQQLAWVAQHGANGWVTETTPYPLRPGTAPINSGECFNCGIVGHVGSRCAVPLDKRLHRNEQVWRALCTNVFREPTGIRLVSTSDYGTVEEVEDVGGDFYGFYGQGNGGGLLE